MQSRSREICVDMLTITCYNKYNSTGEPRAESKKEEMIYGYDKGHAPDLHRG